MRFTSGEEMLDVITSGSDLYSKGKGIYVFCYNINGSIAHYNISDAKMKKLIKEAGETGECISGLLGPGGSIADDPSYGFFQDGDYSNLDWCNDHYEGDWVAV